MVGTVGCSSLVDSWCNLVAPKLNSSSSFLQYSSSSTPLWGVSTKLLLRNNKLNKNKKKKNRKKRNVVVVDELQGPAPPPPNQDDNFDDVKQQILDYFTYKAVRTVMNQLYEMNPPQYRWFYHYVASNEHGYGKTFIRNLVKDQQELAERVMITRLHLYQRWTKFCDHTKMYERISDQNLALMRERLMETVVWPSEDEEG